MGFRRFSFIVLFGPLVLGMTLSPSPADGSGNFAGPVEAVVISVLDGDTFLAQATIWPGQSVRTNVRIRGIDAPEMKAKCPAERLAAMKARGALAALVAGRKVRISNIGGAKYYGRVLADVASEDGVSIAPLLLDRALVRRYGGGRRKGWCG